MIKIWSIFDQGFSDPIQTPFKGSGRGRKGSQEDPNLVYGQIGYLRRQMISSRPGEGFEEVRKRSGPGHFDQDQGQKWTKNEKRASFSALVFFKNF